MRFVAVLFGALGAGAFVVVDGWLLSGFEGDAGRGDFLAFGSEDDALYGFDDGFGSGFACGCDGLSLGRPGLREADAGSAEEAVDGMRGFGVDAPFGEGLEGDEGVELESSVIVGEDEGKGVGDVGGVAASEFFDLVMEAAEELALESGLAARGSGGEDVSAKRGHWRASPLGGQIFSAVIDSVRFSGFLVR